MKRLISALLVTCMVLCLAACGEKPQPTEPVTEPAVPSTAPVTEPTVPDTEPPTEAPTEMPTEPVTEPAPEEIYYSPLTGEVIAAPMTSRPYAVMHNNIQKAQPQCGSGSADIFYEVMVEGGITRCMGIYSSLPGDQPMGSMRSARLYYCQIAQGYDAIYVHAGGSEEAYGYLSETKYGHIDGVNGPGASRFFYRDQDRLNAGFALEHTMFIKASDIEAYVKDQNIPTERNEAMDYGLHFVEDGTPADGTDASTVVVNFRYGGKTTTFNYDDTAGVYNARQYGNDFIDGNTGKPLSFTNLIIIESTDKVIDNAGRLRVDTVGSGKGYFACGGKIIPITWSRDGVYDNFVYRTADGAELNLGVGKTYIGIIAVDAPVKCS